MGASENNSDDLPIVYDTQFTRNLKLGFFIVVTPLSLLCNSALIYYLLIDRAQRRVYQHHGILALLVVCFLLNSIEVPRVMHYLRIGTVTLQTAVHCLLWQWLDYLLGGLVNVLMCWISFERYLFVFHSHLFNTARSRLVVHCLPLFTIVVCVSLFYIYAFFVYPCEQQFDFSQPLCGLPCYSFQAGLSLYDLFAHIWLPLAFSVLLDIGLILRVVLRKRIGQQEQRSRWQKHRRMMLQVLTISGLFLIVQTPYALVLFMQIIGGQPTFALYAQIVYFYYFLWLFSLLLPIVCIGIFPELKSKLRDKFRHRIEPVTHTRRPV